jgi:ectoine hydroxylase-related dioxygenase (phytanoyl-CoA dioxygenase family)
MGLVYVRDLYGPSLEFKHPKGRSNLKPDCKPSTDDLNDLVVRQDVTDEEAIVLVQKNGAAVIPDILDKETAREFRDFVMKANEELDDSQVFVKGSTHRFNLMPDVTAPVIQRVLKQVSEHARLRPLIDGVLFPGASLVNFSVLTAAYGAEHQQIHADTSTSIASYPDLFVPEYALVIALQDTTEEMGATVLCPGTQLCKSVANEEGDDNEDDYGRICKVRATLKQGDGFLYISDLYHRGAAHFDRHAPERAFLFLIFAQSRQGPHDRRRLPFGQVRALDWKRWGHTIEDMAHSERWRWWHSLGLFNRKGNVRPWTIVDNILLIFQTDVAIHAISNDFDKEAFEKVVDKAVLFTGIFALLAVHLVLLPALLFAWYHYLIRSDSSFYAGRQQNGKEKVQ